VAHLKIEPDIFYIGLRALSKQFKARKSNCPNDLFGRKFWIERFDSRFITFIISCAKSEQLKFLYIFTGPTLFIRHCITEKCRNDIKCKGMRGVARVVCRSHYQSRDLVWFFPSFSCTFSTSNYLETDALRCHVFTNL